MTLNVLNIFYNNKITSSIYANIKFYKIKIEIRLYNQINIVEIN